MRFSFLMASAVAVALSQSMPSIDGSCSSTLDCSLNGECESGKCFCDKEWSGSLNCDVLTISSTPVTAGYHNDTQASWGANVVFEDGKYHMFVAQFANSW
jgi:hypothetical protein